MKQYIKNTINNNYIFIAIISFVLFVQIIYANTDNHLKEKQTSLENLNSEIKSLENTLSNYKTNQGDTQKKINEVKKRIDDEKELLLTNKEKKEFQSTVLFKSKITLDSLKNNLQEIINQKQKTALLIKNITDNNKIIKIKLMELSDSITYTNQLMSATLDTLNSLKNKLKNIIAESSINPEKPKNIEFIFEAETWDEFILHSTLYDVIIKKNKQKINDMLYKQKKIENKYDYSLNYKKELIADKRKLSEKMKTLEANLIKINIYYNSMDDLINQKQNFVNQIQTKYDTLSLIVDEKKNKLQLLNKQLNDINTTNQLTADKHKKIEYKLILKKESHKKIQEEINKLLKKDKKLYGKKIEHSKTKLPWPINGTIITKFGTFKNPETNVIFDNNAIEIVRDEVLYITGQLKPSNPETQLVKKFQRLTMNMKEGDFGYGVFGPQTTKTWKKYNTLKEQNNKENIIAVHEGEVETIKFLDPITGVIIIIRHNNNSFSVYSGKIEPTIMKNTIIKSGAKIGLIKNEDILKFQLLINGLHVNPEKWLIKK